MSERRKHERKRSTRYILVVNGDTEEHLGCLVDLTAEGMRLMGNKSINSGSIFRLIIKINDTKAILVDAQSRWCKKNDNPEIFETGFLFHNITKDNLAKIKELIDSPLFKESLLFASSELG